MASSGTNNQSIDDLLVTIMSMGFELEDAQQAVQAGKLTAEQAIEWILQGKPPATRPAASGPSLRLNAVPTATPTNMIGSNPFANPQAVPLPGVPAQGISSQMDVTDEEEKKVVSRSHLNEEQRQIKERFEEKRREEARRTAMENKRAEKKAHAAILAEIAKDRELQKLKRGAASPPQKPIETPSSPEKTSKTESSAACEEKKSDSCLLQIRLPNGQAVRETFNADAPLENVLTFVKRKTTDWSGMVFMQPFPRQEFGEEHMTCTLRELKLVPSGNLVLKKPDRPKPEPEEPMDTEKASADESESSAPESKPESTPPVAPPVSPPNHFWGSGQVLQPGENQGQEQVEEQEQGEAPAGQLPGMEEDNESDDEEDMAGGGFPGGLGPGGLGPGGLGPGGGGGMLPGFGGGQGHQWGEGQSLAGQVLNPDNLPHHRRDPRELAVETARERFAVAPRTDTGAGSSAPAVLHTVSTLVHLTVRHISARICDSRHPILGLQGLPADLAMKLLENLKKEGLLRPKTLSAFISSRLRTVVLDCYPYTTNELLHALRFHVYISHLSLVSCSLITDKGLQSITALKRIKHLNLGGCKQLNNNIIPVLVELPQLSTLVLENTGITDAGIEELVASSPQNLQYLNLNGTSVTHRVIITVQGIPNLKSLSLEQTQVASLSGIQNMAQLESLNVASTHINTDSLLCLREHPSLTALNVANTQNVIGDVTLFYVKDLPLQLLQMPSKQSTSDLGLSYLSGMPLHTLDLTNYNRITDVGAEHIGKIHSLRKLRLSNTKITDAGMPFLAGLTHLEELYLDRVLITDVGAAVLAAFTNLRELSLSETSITNHFLRQGTLHHCPSLAKLNLSKTSISNKGVRHLCLPNLTLLNLDCTRVRWDIEETVHQNCPHIVKVMMKNTQPLRDSEEEEG